MSATQYSQVIEEIYLAIEQSDSVEYLQGLLAEKFALDIDLHNALSHFWLDEVKEKLFTRCMESFAPDQPLPSDRYVSHLNRVLKIIAVAKEVEILQHSLFAMLDLLGCYLVLEDDEGIALISMLPDDLNPSNCETVALLSVDSELQINGGQLETCRLVRNIGHKFEIDVVRKLYPLNVTNSEAKVIEGLLNGETLKTYAENNALSQHTVKSQTKSILGKLSVHSQVELIHYMYKEVLSPFIGVTQNTTSNSSLLEH